MANPTLSKKSDKSLTLAEGAKKIFQVIYREQNKKDDKTGSSIPKIRVSDLISKMAFYYEKIRYTVDYKEEHLLRKNAIERILRRQIIIEGAISTRELKDNQIAKHLLTELIRAAYLPNNTIPESRIDEVGRVIHKYLKLREYSTTEYKNNHKGKAELNKWIIALAASEIEEKLGRSETDLTVINYMNEILNKNIELADNSSHEKDKEIQINIGIHRNLLKFDQEMLSAILLKHYYPNWENLSDDEIRKISKDITPLVERIESQLDHPLTRQMNRIISRYTVFFTVLTDVIKDDPVGCYESIKNDPKAFPRQIKIACEKRYKSTRVTLWRAAVRSIFYIFITKSIFAVILEVPATTWLGQEINNFSLAVNIGFPALLLFMIVLFTKVPTEKNSRLIIEGIEEVVFVEHEKKEPFRLRRPVVRGKMMNSVFGLIYAITFFLSFGAIIIGLNRIGFNFVSIIIFLFFLAFVSFFSIRIRKNTKELLIIPPKENILSLFADFFYVPIVSAGKWLSEKFSRINVFVFILDFIIEAPFKIFIEMAEEWTNYVKERKEEIV